MTTDYGLPRLVVDRGGAPHRIALPVAEVRRLEAELMATLPDGALMQRAAAALDVECARLLREETGGVAGRRIVLLVGAGDNGGDALFAGARLARRGASVAALLVADRHHLAGAAALRAAGGVLRQVHDESGSPTPEPHRKKQADPANEAEKLLIHRADLVVDGILGIGGRGGLRGVAELLCDTARGRRVLAVDLPSGVDADTGATPGTAVHATHTVTMGVLKPGLLVGPGAAYAGRITVVDIGLPLGVPGGLRLSDGTGGVRHCFARPAATDDKYTRGVVGISAGSARYPGAAVLATGAARHGPAGYVRYAGHAAASVVARWPDVVAVDGPIERAGRVHCWVVGPGRGTDAEAVAAVRDALASEVPVVLDADALTVVAEHAEIREAIRDREDVTVLTPHAGEFARLGGGDLEADRIGAVAALADELHAVILLKGSATLVVPPLEDGVRRMRLVTVGPPELATAGSGDVLSGLVGATLARARALSAPGGAPPVWRPHYLGYLGYLGTVPSYGRVVAAVASAAYVHGVAGRVAAEGGRSVAALDVLRAVPEAVARVRRAARTGR